MQEIFQKNGIDSSYLIAIENSGKYSTYVKKKYKVYFLKYPTLWEDMKKETLKNIAVGNDKNK